MQAKREIVPADLEMFCISKHLSRCRRDTYQSNTYGGGKGQGDGKGEWIGQIVATVVKGPLGKQ